MTKQSVGIYSILSILLLSIIWNYWLPSASDYLNMVSPTYDVANVDFFAYYRGGEAYLRGVEPYAGTRDGQLYIYPPTLVPLYGLLAGMPYNDARIVWVVVYASLFLLTAFLAVLQAKPGDRWPLALVILFIVSVSYPLRYLIKQGQIDLIVASLSFLSFVVYRWKLRWLSALILSIAAFVKLNPIFFLITFVFYYRDWKYLVWFGFWSLSIIGVSLLFFPLDWYRAFLMEVLPALTKSQTFYYNQTPLRFFAGDRWIPRIITLSGLGILTVIGLALGRNRVRTSVTIDYKSADAFFLLNALVILVISGSAWIMAYVWFILPVAVVLVTLIVNAKPIYVAGVGLAVATSHARLIDLPILNAINMLGAGFLIVLLVIYLFFPDMILKPSNRSDGMQEAVEP